MPRELSSSEEREYDDYRSLGPAADVRAKVAKLPKVQAEAAESRKRVEALEKENGELKAKVPDGAVVLTGDDAKAYEAASAKHGGVAGLVKKAERAEEVEKEIATRDRQDAYRKAARTEGWSEEAALGFFNDSETFKALPFEIRKVDREVKGTDGKTTKESVDVGFVTVDGKQMPLSEWQSANAKHWTPGLTATGKQGQQDAGGREYFEQVGRSSGDAKSTDAKARAKEANAQAASRPNALRPASTNA
jgi:hypothetical protein